jgi:peptide/nickel transport system substrate-binding protein
MSMKLWQRIALVLAVAALTLGWVHGLGAQPKPVGEMVIAWPFTIYPAWFDPLETPAQITPFGILYALHDAVVRPMPGERLGNSLAESWTETSDGLVVPKRYLRALHGGKAPGGGAHHQRHPYPSLPVL